MKIAILLFPISAEGGLTTRAFSYYKMFKSFGHNPTFYRIRYSARFHGTGTAEPVVHAGSGGNTLEHRHLSIDDTCLHSTLKTLAAYDRLIFVHPCPHVSDKQKAVANWRVLYTDLMTKKVVTFTDVYWDKYYPWIRDVLGTFKGFSVNSAVHRHVSKLMHTRLLPHMLTLPERPNFADRRPNDVLWANAWRGWKGIEKVVTALPKSTWLTARLYGSGRETINLADNIRAFPQSIKMMGQAPPETIISEYSRSNLALDLTGASEKYFGHYNRTVLEPMLYGCGVGVRPELVAPHSPIPQDVVFLMDCKDPKTLVASMEQAVRLRDVPKLQRAYEFVRTWCDPKAVEELLLA